MSLYIIIGVIAILAIAFLSFKVFKGVLRIVFSIASSLILIIGILGAIIYMDVQKANNLLEEGEKIILYEHNGTCLVGVRVENTNIEFTEAGTFPKGVQAINKTTCTTLLANAKNNELENSLLMVINEEVLAAVEEVDVFGYEMEKESMEDILMSDTPKEEFISIILEQEEIPEAQMQLAENEINEGLEFINRTELKASIFLLLINEVMNEEEGEKYLLHQVKEKNIGIYPQFLIIKGIQWIPNKAFDKALEKVEKMTSEV